MQQPFRLAKSRKFSTPSSLESSPSHQSGVTQSPRSQYPDNSVKSSKLRSIAQIVSVPTNCPPSVKAAKLPSVRQEGKIYKVNVSAVVHVSFSAPVQVAAISFEPVLGEYSHIAPAYRTIPVEVTCNASRCSESEYRTICLSFIG